jgi:hypothetical protein
MTSNAGELQNSKPVIKWQEILDDERDEIERGEKKCGAPKNNASAGTTRLVR